jgi:hypothetical protein
MIRKFRKGNILLQNKTPFFQPRIRQREGRKGKNKEGKLT